MKIRNSIYIIITLIIMIIISVVTKLPVIIQNELNSIIEGLHSENDDLSKQIKERFLYNYINDRNISDNNGFPKDSTIMFFRVELFPDKIKYQDNSLTTYDTFFVKLFSDDLHELNEPILYNTFLDKEIYRFVWLRSFNPNIILRLEKELNQVKLIQKKYHKYISYNEDHNDHINNYTKVDSILSQETEKYFDLKFWREFQNQLEKYKYFQMPTIAPWIDVTDGAEWFLEAHLHDGYYMVNRWSPGALDDMEFRKLCDFLIDSSDFYNEQRY